MRQFAMKLGDGKKWGGKTQKREAGKKMRNLEEEDKKRREISMTT